MENKKFCKYCGKEIDSDAIVCPKCGKQVKIIKTEEIKQADEEKISKNAQNKKPFYMTSWFMWVMLFVLPPLGIFFMWKFQTNLKKNTKIIITIIFSIFFLFALINGDSNQSSTQNNSNANQQSIKKKIEVIDFSTMQETDILSWCSEKNITCNIKRIYSNSVTKDGFISQSINAKESIEVGGTITITYSLGVEPTTEQKNAYKKAEEYASIMHMSKMGIYDQLTSEFGEGFDKESAQYAIDNLAWDWNANALATAKNYRDTLHMSKSAIYEQLVSSYGEKFTAEEAQYAIDHLDD